MLFLPTPLHYLLAATYLAAGSLILWWYWEKLPSITHPLGGRLLIAFTITALLLGFFVVRRGAVGASTPATSMSELGRDTRGSCPTGEQYKFSTRDRTRFRADFPKVLGYPSSGGVLILPLDVAVAEYLGIPRLEIAHRASNPTDEDAFCNRLRLLGAKWWRSEDTYYRKLIGFEAMTEMEKKKGITVGWPAKEGKGGVWILRSGKGLDTAMLGMCVSMEERCELLKKWGATFYENPKDVEEFEEVVWEESIEG